MSNLWATMAKGNECNGDRKGPMPWTRNLRGIRLEKPWMLPRGDIMLGTKPAHPSRKPMMWFKEILYCSKCGKYYTGKRARQLSDICPGVPNGAGIRVLSAIRRDKPPSCTRKQEWPRSDNLPPPYVGGVPMFSQL